MITNRIIMGLLVVTVIMQASIVYRQPSLPSPIGTALVLIQA